MAYDDAAVQDVIDDAERMAEETNHLLAEAVRRGDNENYIEAYSGLASFLGLPFITTADNPNKFTLVSSVIGQPIGFRARTTKEEDRQVLKRAQDVIPLIRKLPIEFRQGLLTYFMHNSFPKIATAAAVLQTANMGKSIKESKEEVAGKGKAWFDYGASPEVRNYITNYAQEGIREGWHLNDLSGKHIRTKAQLEMPGAMIATYYKKSSKTVPENKEIHGSGLAVEQICSNYLALAFPSIAVAIPAGNVNVTKLNAETPDAFEAVRKAFLHDARHYMRKYGPDLKAEVLQEVDLRRESVIEVIAQGLVQSVTSRGWERVANTFRIVGGMETGADVYESRMASDLSDDDKERTCAELAGDNALYLDEMSEREMEEVADWLLARVSSNSGMICTRINLVMAKSGATYEKFRMIIEDKFSLRTKDATQYIGNPHDIATQQGALMNRSLYKGFTDNIAEMRREGVIVIGGEQLYSEKGGIYVSPAIAIWPKGTERIYEAMRAKNHEVFAPITNLISAKDHKEAARISNLSGNSLTSAIISSNDKTIFEFGQLVDARTVNVGNKKLGSDNSPGGPHFGKYSNVVMQTSNGRRVIDIVNNGPTGSLEHYAQHLNVPANVPDKSYWVQETSKANFVVNAGIKLR